MSPFYDSLDIVETALTPIQTHTNQLFSQIQSKVYL